MIIDPEAKQSYNELISENKKLLTGIDKETSILRKRILKEKKIAPLLRIGIIINLLKQIDIRLKMNQASEQIMNTKNNGFLDAGRKDIYKIFVEVDAIVTLRLDEPINFNREMLDAIKPFNTRQRFNMYKHVKKFIKDLIYSYGESTKWKWSFPELWTKLVSMGKNIFDFREFQATRDPRKEFYYDFQDFLKVLKDDLFFAAGENANKFRISTQSANDIMMGVRLLEDLRRISSLTGDEKLTKKSKAGIESYKTSLKLEEERKEKKRIQEKVVSN